MSSSLVVVSAGREAVEAEVVVDEAEDAEEVGKRLGLERGGSEE